MRLIKYIALLLSLILPLAACAMAESGGEARKLSIVVTDFPCYDFARQAAGERASVKMLIAPGAEVHTYEPAPADIVALQSADLFIYIGGESDAWADALLDANESGPRVLRLMDYVEAREEELVEGMQADPETAHTDEEEAEYDEHIWTSPVNAVRMLEAVRDALTELDPENAQAYSADADAYIAEVEALDAEFRAIVDGAARRELVFGDRFPFLYFAREYGLDYYAAFPGCSSAAEPSAKTVAGLIDRVRTDGIPVVYIIELSSGQIARTIAGETGAEVLTLHSCQTISLDDFEAGETYVSLMRRNAEALKKGLN